MTRSLVCGALVVAALTVADLHSGVSARTPEGALAPTPPMGWNSWNKFGCDVSEALIRETADAVVSSGMKAAGYQYVVIDDCWQVARDAKGHIVPDPTRFASGMKVLGDYVHARGLKFGVYSDSGTKTCQGRPGGHGFETVDAQDYAAWGVDYLKYDWCHTEGIDAYETYTTMSKALVATGRPIVFSLCEWGRSKPWTWAKAVGQLWRTTDDIQDCWECAKDKYDSLSVVDILDLQAPLAQFAGPDGWNDPDMLEVGNGGMTETEYRAHFTMWAMLAAPLIAGNDLRHMSEETKTILLNADVIAIDQDPLGKQATRIRDDGDQEVWARPLADGGEAVALLNRGKAPAKIKVSWSEALPKGGASTMTDLWTHKASPVQPEGYEATVPPHGVVAFRIHPAKR
jgi:alpha-galactosidase